MLFNSKPQTTLQTTYHWLPSLYFMQGLPFAFVTTLSLIFFKNFHFNNIEIAFYTSLFSLPLFLKPLFAPAMENTAEKKTWILVMSLLMSILFLLLALSLNFDNFFYLSMIIFFVIAFVSMIYDTHVDGLYIDYLDKPLQAHFIGIRTLGYQIGKFSCQSGMVLLAGLFFTYFGIKTSWQIAFLLLSIITLILTVYHYYILPNYKTSTREHRQDTLQHFKLVIKEFLAIPQLTYIIVFIFIYQITENQLQKIVPLFLLDTSSHGGLAFSTAQVGTLNGLAIISMMLGILVSGFILARISLKKCLVPFTLFTTASSLGYLLISIYSCNHIFIVGLIAVLAQFSFGMGNGIYMLYLLHHFGHGKYSMSLYAIGTSLMGLSMLVGGAMSGYLQFNLGYTGFFIWIAMVNLLVIFYSYFLAKV